MLKFYIITFFSLILSYKTSYAQKPEMLNKGRVELLISFNLLPINQQKSQVNFIYQDGNSNSSVPIDTISANYSIPKKKFGSAFSIGAAYYVTSNLKTLISLKPYLNSFLSNQKKNKKVYGVHLNIATIYEHQINRNSLLPVGISFSRLIGGYGITSGGATKKEYLIINGNQLYDRDIGFHIVDKAWLAGIVVGYKHKIFEHTFVYGNIQYQWAFSRTSKLNFAGTTKDGQVKWNSKNYNDQDLSLIINNQTIKDTNISSLPFSFGGLAIESGVSFFIKK